MSSQPQIIEAWTRPQKRIELPPFRLLWDFDDEDKERLKTILDEPRFEFYCEMNNEGDFEWPHANGSVSRICEMPAINGIQWFLQPGKNMIPKSFYEFLMACPHQKQLMPSPTPDNFQDLTYLLQQ